MDQRGELSAILGKARAFWEARILMTAAEIDVFSLLLDTPKTSAQLSRELSSDQRATEALLNALVALGLLVKTERTFRVRPGFERVLSNSAPETVLPVIRHMAQLWDSWGRLTEIVRTGEARRSVEELERDEQGVRAFIGAMHTIGLGLARSVVARLDLSGRRNLIDVGGGSGVYTIAVLQAAPEMRATVFDRPLVTEVARQRLAEEGMSDRVELVNGDFYVDVLPAGHDLALLSAIIHQNDAEQNIELYRKVFDALVPGGTLVVRDFVMSEDHTEPPDGAFFAINMLVNTPGGSTYSFEEISEDLEAAGFVDAELLHRGEMDGLITARKPTTEA
ncbi:MAG: methyltransferase [Deltaproteobacteria bacterium]|nr:methyltransferase [Deltaproteobacteria bacterium]